MKKTRLLPLAVVPFLLTGCGPVSKFMDNLPKYVFSRKYHEKYNILQLTDIHWNINSSTYESKRYMDKLLAEADRHIKQEVDNGNPEAKIDLVELTGDMFMLSNSYEVRDFVNYFDKKAEQYGFEYAIIWGNHDRHGMYNPNWLSDQFRKAKHAIYYEPNDDLYGRSNFMINLTEDGTENTAPKWQIANLDSGASFSESPLSPFRDYDYIRKDQTQWWLEEQKAASNQAGFIVPGIAYYHIPQDENLKMYEERASHKNKFFKLEDFADNGMEEYASDFIDEAIKRNLKGAFMGHAHNVDWTVEMEDAGTGNKMLLGLGVKTGIELYYAHIDVNTNDPLIREGLDSIASAGITENFDLIGASLVTITDEVDNIEGKFDLEHLYYNERESGDFKVWVKF